jgi:hypothetical protein
MNAWIHDDDASVIIIAYTANNVTAATTTKSIHIHTTSNKNKQTINQES